MNAPKTLFLSHGSPMIALEASSASRFLAELGQSLPRPRAVLAVSAHWQIEGFAVGGASSPRTIHDFFGFPPPLYDMRYPASGDPDLAARVADRTGAALVAGRGLDHGIWTVARLMWPDADVAVVPVSVSRRGDPAEHWDFGRALAPLLDDGVMLMATGCATHNLQAYHGQPRDIPAEDRVLAFTDWLSEKVQAGDRQALVDYRRQAPHAAWNHPSDEHLMPLFVAAGAGDGKGRSLHHSVEHGVIAMDAFGWMN
ncbi:MAG: dioxygenase [Magnetospirillum gryphiswaldense]|nr:dioxygenase [Magnetospirillum gryphiswaldense]